MSIWGKERHLTIPIATVGAVCVGLDELPNGKTIRCFVGRDGYMLAHERTSLGLKDGTSSIQLKYAITLLNNTSIRPKVRRAKSTSA
jgi:hypothetical protein